MPTMSVKQRTSDIAIENADVRFSPMPWKNYFGTARKQL